MFKSGLFRTGSWMAMVAAILVAQACDSPSGLRELNGVAAEARNQQVVVANKSESAVFTMIIGRNAETRVDWLPCVDAGRCPPIRPGESRAHPYGSLLLDAGEKEVVVHWWHAVTDGSGVAHATDIQSLIIPLQ
jgi:hypothetical protein